MSDTQGNNQNNEVVVKTPMSNYIKGGFGLGCGCLIFLLLIFVFLPAACTVGTVGTVAAVGAAASENTSSPLTKSNGASSTASPSPKGHQNIEISANQKGNGASSTASPSPKGHQNIEISANQKGFDKIPTLQRNPNLFHPEIQMVHNSECLLMEMDVLDVNNRSALIQIFCEIFYEAAEGFDNGSWAISDQKIKLDKFNESYVFNLYFYHQAHSKIYSILYINCIQFGSSSKLTMTYYTIKTPEFNQLRVDEGFNALSKELQGISRDMNVERITKRDGVGQTDFATKELQKLGNPRTLQEYRQAKQEVR